MDNLHFWYVRNEMYVNVLPVTDDYSRGECPVFDILVLKTDKINFSVCLSELSISDGHIPILFSDL